MFWAVFILSFSILRIFNLNLTFAVCHKGDSREVKHHVYVKRQTRIVPRDQVSSITCRLLFIISTHKLVVLPNFLSIRIVLSCFFSARFLLWEILNLNLTFAVCCIREASTPFYLTINSRYWCPWNKNNEKPEIGTMLDCIYFFEVEYMQQS